MRVTRSLPIDVAEWYDDLVGLGWLAAPFIVFLAVAGVAILAMRVAP